MVIIVGLAFGNDLPIIRIDTKNEVPILDKVNYVPAKFSLIDLNNIGNNVSKSDFKDGIRGRGNLTWTFSKKPYRIKFDKKTSLFGLEAAKSWILLAEYLDPTFLITSTVFYLGDIFGISFNHHLYNVQLYLNGQYNGIYILTEHNQVGIGRVNIDENEGWLVEIDTYYDEEPKFKTAKYDLPIMIKSPETEPPNINNPVYNFIRKDINELCDSMASSEFPENGYRELIDMNTFVDYVMINEVVLNKELGHPKSVYAYKDKGGKISMGPLWDFDFAFSYVDNGSSNPGHTYFKYFKYLSWKHNFFERLFEDPIFLVKYKERWNEKYNEILAVPNFIDELGKKLEAPFVKDYERWKNSYNSDYPKNYIGEIEKMKTWWNNRVLWLNTELNKVEILPKSKIFASHLYGYSNIPSQTFTLVAYGDIENLSATLKNGNLSDFEISTELSQTKATGGGGYLATISIKPLNSLLATTYTDTLILSGSNQGKPFLLKIPLITSDTPNLPIRPPQIAQTNIRAYAIGNTIVLQNLPSNAKVEAYNLQGKLISRHSLNQASHGSDNLRIPIHAKGIYFVKIGTKAFRISVM